MDIFGPLTPTASGSRFVLVLIDHFTRWVNISAAKRMTVDEVTRVLLEQWIPAHGVPGTLLSDNGPQFVAEALLRVCESMGIRKIYSSPYYPQGNSVVESFMRTLRKGLAALVSEGRSDWDRYLQAVAFAHNSTPSVTTGYSPFFLTYGREAVLPVQRHLDEPRLDGVARDWLSRLWRSRAAVYESHIRESRRKEALLRESGSTLPVGSVVAVLNTPTDLQDTTVRKLALKYSAPWIVVEAYANGVTYRVQDPTSKEIRQVPRLRLKLLELPEEVPRVEDCLLRFVAQTTEEPPPTERRVHFAPSVPRPLPEDFPSPSAEEVARIVAGPLAAPPEGVQNYGDGVEPPMERSTRALRATPYRRALAAEERLRQWHEQASRQQGQPSRQQGG